MSTIRANTITDTAGTGAPTFSNGIKTNAILDASGGNTATINGKLPIAIGDVPASMTLLGTLATTSGTSVTLSGLTLTSYKFLQIIINGFSGTIANPSNMRLNGWDIALTNNAAATAKGGSTVDLTTGVFWGVTQSAIGGSGNTPALAGLSGLTTASTSITFTSFSDYGATSFDAGSITIYGVK